MVFLLPSKLTGIVKMTILILELVYSFTMWSKENSILILMIGRYYYRVFKMCFIMSCPFTMLSEKYISLMLFYPFVLEVLSKHFYLDFNHIHFHFHLNIILLRLRLFFWFLLHKPEIKIIDIIMVYLFLKALNLIP